MSFARLWLLRRSPRERVLAYALVLFGLGSGLLASTPDPTITPDRPWSLPFLVLILAFGLAESTALHVEIRKESHSLSLSGIPMMFGLLYVSPVQLIAAYLLGAVPAMLWVRHSDLLKTAWNSSLFFAEAALGSFIVRTFLDSEFPNEFGEWLLVLTAILAAELLSLVAVPIVIMAVDSKFRPNLFADVGQSQILAALGGTFTVTAVSSSIANPLMLIYAAIPVIGVAVLLQTHGRLGQRYKDLQKLHEFTRALTNERGARTLDIGLTELVQIMRSMNAGLLITADADVGESSLRVLRDETLENLDPLSIADLLPNVLSIDEVTRLTTDDPRDEVRLLLKRLDAAEVLAVPVLRETDRQAVLFVSDRLGMANHFRPDEISLFASLAQTLSARLLNDHLVEQLESQALHDSLTGLPNRLTFEVALAAQLADPERHGVVVMLDLDRFKDVNDSLGHDVGDQLLIEIARRLSKSSRSSDLVSRFGGDEFALFFSGRVADGPLDVDRRLRDFLERLTSQVQLGGIMFEIGASLGVASWPEHGEDTDSLIRYADAAMYHAKRNQLGIAKFSAELDTDTPRRLDLSMAIRAALEDEDVQIHVQPKVSTTDGRLIGGEVLARWTHPIHGSVPPAEFIPLVTQAGFTGALTRLVTRSAARTMAELRSKGVDIPLAINLTAHDLLDPRIPDDLQQILRDAGLGCDALMVEITEDAMIVDFDTSVSVLTHLRDLGATVAIDDFGTGYSSLQHLHRLPIDQLKIDRSFISRLTEDTDAEAIVRAAINLAHDLGLTTVAEGVEDEACRTKLAQLGCEEIQGYLVSKPLPTEQFIDWASTQVQRTASTDAAGQI